MNSLTRDLTLFLLTFFGVINVAFAGSNSGVLAGAKGCHLTIEATGKEREQLFMLVPTIYWNVQKGRYAITSIGKVERALKLVDLQKNPKWETLVQDDPKDQEIFKLINQAGTEGNGDIAYVKQGGVYHFAIAALKVEMLFPTKSDMEKALVELKSPSSDEIRWYADDFLVKMNGSYSDGAMLEIHQTCE